MLQARGCRLAWVRKLADLKLNVKRDTAGLNRTDELYEPQRVIPVYSRVFTYPKSRYPLYRYIVE